MLQMSQRSSPVRVWERQVLPLEHASSVEVLVSPKLWQVNFFETSATSMGLFFFSARCSLVVLYSSLHKSCHLALCCCSVASMLSPSSKRDRFIVLGKHPILLKPTRRSAINCLVACSLRAMVGLSRTVKHLWCVLLARSTLAPVCCWTKCWCPRLQRIHHLVHFGHCHTALQSRNRVQFFFFSALL